ncbi:MAG: glycerol-3-phosphate 1-O-acyltransferase PlsY [Clostridia bacterium]|nr:glycerol-3-phosphate 1-O-acyltransferase PlsY [Clostridia bacterium]
MLMYFLIAVILICGYLIGSVNAAVIISKTFYKSDIRTHGSGNAGTTNMLRTFGKKAAAGTFLVDLLKGVVAALIGMLVIKLFGFDTLTGSVFGAIGAILGHNWPVYFGFKGGKGVLTSFAVLLVIMPIPSLICLGVFVIVVLISRYVSLGSMIGAFALPFIVYFLGSNLGIESGFTMYFVLSVFVAVLLIARHYTNIGRLIKGTESKLFSGKKKDNSK